MNGLAARNPQSVRFTVVAWTLTSTAWSLAAGFSTSTTRTTSGGPYLVRTAALMGEHYRQHHGLGEHPGWVDEVGLAAMPHALSKAPGSGGLAVVTNNGTGHGARRTGPDRIRPPDLTQPRSWLATG
jgi:hypothetical protein